MAEVFTIWFDRELPSGEDDERFLGVYSTQAKAEAALARFKLHPEFKDFPDKLEINACTLDRTHWQEGFVDVPHEDLVRERLQ